MAKVDIKLTREQHDILLFRLGSEYAIHDWLESSINQRLKEIAAEMKTQSIVS